MHEHLVRSGLPPPVDSVDSPACLPPIAVILALGQAGRSTDVSMLMFMVTFMFYVHVFRTLCMFLHVARFVNVP